MANVLVTGGAGFLGSHLVDRLLDEGHRVRVLDDLSTGSLRNLQPAADRPGGPAPGAPVGPSPRLELMIGDVRDERLVRKAMRHVDLVFHLAALPATAVTPIPAEIHTVNVQGTLNVLQAATAEGARRVVFASCASVYGPVEGRPVTEDLPLHPVTVFGASKLAGEIYCGAYRRAHQMETVVLRYFTVYGPRQHPLRGGTVVPTLLETLREQRRPVIFGDGRAGQDFLYVDDAVAATVAAGTSPEAAGLAINVGSGQVSSVNEVLDILKRLLRTDVAPRMSRARPGHFPPVRARVELADRVLGVAPRVSLVAGLARCVECRAQDERVLAEVGTREQRADV
jgi:UDP-N-acetylglucosamine/UDP-N-acetyl-alpha-D-glucosaminouronate 4-epimerase